MSKVKVTADAAGNVIVPSKNNPEFGYVRVEQEKVVYNDETGFMTKKLQSALIHGTVADLQSQNYSKGQELEGKILIRESLTPMSKKNPENDYKVAGKSGVICSVEGQPIYSKSTFSVNIKAEDVLIKHDNTEEIRAKIAADKFAEEANLKSLLTEGAAGFSL